MAAEERDVYEQLYKAVGDKVIDLVVDAVASHIVTLVNEDIEPSEKHHASYEYTSTASMLCRAITAVIRGYNSPEGKPIILMFSPDLPHPGTLEFYIDNIAECFYFEPMDTTKWQALVRATAQLLTDTVSSWI